MQRLEKLEQAKARAEKIVSRAEDEVHEAVGLLREIGIDPDSALAPQIAELEAEAVRSKELADKLLEELSAQLEGN